MSTAPYTGYVYAVHLRGDLGRRVPRTRCGKDTDFHKNTLLTDDLGEATCSSCIRLHNRDVTLAVVT